MLRIDDIPQQVADDIQGLYLDLFARTCYNKLTENPEFVGVNDENFIYDWWHYVSWKNNCVSTAQTGFTE